MLFRSRLLLTGRQFLLPGGGWLILGRNEQENARLLTMVQEGDAVLSMPVRPGPTALLRRPGRCYEYGAQLQEALQLAASLVVRFGKKMKDGPAEGEVRISMGRETHTLTVPLLADHVFQGWILNDADR